MVSRRSTRMFADEQESMESGNTERTSQTYDEKESYYPQKEKAMAATNAAETRRMPLGEFGIDLGSIRPATAEDLGKQANNYLSAKSRVDGKPLNFGIVIPGQVYRSSYPVEEDFQYIQSLGLKTVLSLVKKDPFPEEFGTFMRQNHIRHCVVEMAGTKKVEISEYTMRSIMEVVLNEDNYPLLIHCNHGKHRTGCAIAVVRRVLGWDLGAILDEYKEFAAPKIRDCDIKYISEYQISSLQGLFPKKPCPPSPLTSVKMKRMFLFTCFVLILWMSTVLFL